jgi:hypothetical protein
VAARRAPRGPPLPATARQPASAVQRSIAIAAPPAPTAAPKSQRSVFRSPGTIGSWRG